MQAFLCFLLLKEKHNPNVTTQNRHRLARLAQAQLKALPLTEAGAAGSFLWLLSFAEKESDALAASDTSRLVTMQFALYSLGIASYLAMTFSYTRHYHKYAVETIQKTC